MKSEVATYPTTDVPKTNQELSKRQRPGMTMKIYEAYIGLRQTVIEKAIFDENDEQTILSKNEILEKKKKIPTFEQPSCYQLF